MAGRTITQRIQLVGGDEIKVQLEGIGKTGELAFTRLEAAADSGGFSRFGGALDSVRTKMSQVAEVGTRVGERFTRVGESVSRSVGDSFSVMPNSSRQRTKSEGLGRNTFVRIAISLSPMNARDRYERA
jgi:hypothetical protein